MTHKEKQFITQGKRVFEEGLNYKGASEMFAAYLFALNCKENKDFKTYNKVFESFKGVNCLINSYANFNTVELFPESKMGRVEVQIMKRDGSVSYSYLAPNPYQRAHEIVKAFEIGREEL